MSASRVPGHWDFRNPLKVNGSPIGGTLAEGLDYTSDTLTLGLPGSPTNDQTIQPAASTTDDQATLQLLGQTGGAAGSGGNVRVAAGDGGALGGNMIIAAGSGTAGDASGGDVRITAGSASGSGAPGAIKLQSPTLADAAITAPSFIGPVVLPTSDPHIVGAVWNNDGAFAVSTG